MTKEEEIEDFVLRSAAATQRRLGLTHAGRDHEQACMLGLIDYALYGISHAINNLALPVGPHTVLDFIRRGLAEVEFALDLLDPPGPMIAGPTRTLRVVK
jgi:hypothetical protein